MKKVFRQDQNKGIEQNLIQISLLLSVVFLDASLFLNQIKLLGNIYLWIDTVR